jgi:hypothetical protein
VSGDGLTLPPAGGGDQMVTFAADKAAYRRVPTATGSSALAKDRCLPAARFAATRFFKTTPKPMIATRAKITSGRRKNFLISFT